MRHFTKVDWFRPGEAAAAPSNGCTWPFDMGCAEYNADSGGCQVWDMCNVDRSTCSMIDECGQDYGGGCSISDLCQADGGNGGDWCARDACTVDDAYCTFLDYSGDYS
jgi:hypothetical protein